MSGLQARRQRFIETPSPFRQVQQSDRHRDVHLHCVVVFSMSTVVDVAVADRRHVLCNAPPQAVGLQLEDVLRQSEVPIESLVQYLVGSVRTVVCCKPALRGS